MNAKIDPAKPLLFVAMPFGERTDPAGSCTIDFDGLYRDCIAPAAVSAGVEVIRADEETLGGFIHRPMYERLLLAEIVIADLTFANANVFYELGVRHAARPRSTILIFAELKAKIPFDVGSVRALPYELDGAGDPADPAALREALGERLTQALQAESVDSPIFQLLADYPGITLSHEATEAFKARAQMVSEMTVAAYHASRPEADREDALAELSGIRDRALALAEPEEQLLVSLLLGYRDVEGWGEMVDLVAAMPSHLRAVATVRQQLALALNRRNQGDDRGRAIAICESLLSEQGRSAETYGILGRCFKDRWREKEEDGDPGAADALARAIDAYAAGFDADPRDFYPGINLLTLLLWRGEDDDLARLAETAPVVQFAIARRGGLKSGDYWTLATLLTLAAMRGDRALGERALSAIFDSEPHDWMRETTAADLGPLLARLGAAGEETAWVELAISRLTAGRMDVE